MKIVHISDTHGCHKKLDFSGIDGDVLVHSGDFLTQGRDSGYQQEEFEAFISWFEQQPFARKILVAGNHDWYCFHQYCREVDLREPLAEKGIDYLLDSAVEIEGVHFYGAPWQPEFMNWAFNLPAESEELSRHWQAIPSETQVLITHGPAFGWQDVGGRQGRPLGCTVLRNVISHHPNIKLHLFGHIHEAYGHCEDNGRHFYNSCYMNHDTEIMSYPPCIDFDRL